MADDPRRIAEDDQDREAVEQALAEATEIAASYLLAARIGLPDQVRRVWEDALWDRLEALDCHQRLMAVVLLLHRPAASRAGWLAREYDLEAPHA